MAGQKLAQYTVGVDFQVDTKGLQNAMAAVRQQMDIKKFQNLHLDLDIKDAQARYSEIMKTEKIVRQALDKSYNLKLNTYDFNKFTAALNGISFNKVQKDFTDLGATGQRALLEMTKAFTTANLQLTQTHTLLEKMGTTLANTLRWQAATKAIQSVTGSIQQAYYFTKDLDKSLNDIRIVTDKSAVSMEKFTAQAISAAKALGKSTTDYTNASLLYYQQGLSDEEVARRTETTLKAANVTGQAASAVSEELTAVWNGFQVELDKTEETVDKLAAVASHSASNLKEISTAMSKVASAANMTGVNIDQLTAQIATIVSVTRQAPETVGTALKTIYARMSDLKLGETDEEGVSLGDVSGTLQSLGIEILDTTGNLKDMGAVIEEIAVKWDTLNTAQQTALAQSLGGKRQYTNLVALFDNWSMYNQNLKISENSLGTLQRQQDTYMESTRAHLQELATAKEELYASIMDSDTINQGADALKSMVESVTKIVKTLGGGKGVFSTISSILMLALKAPLGKAISTTLQNIDARSINKEIVQKTNDTAKEMQKQMVVQYGEKAQINAVNYLDKVKEYGKSFGIGAISAEQYKQFINTAYEYQEALIQVQDIEEKNIAARELYHDYFKQDLKIDTKEQLIQTLNKIDQAIKEEEDTLQNARFELDEYKDALDRVTAAEKRNFNNEKKQAQANSKRQLNNIYKQKPTNIKTFEELMQSKQININDVTITEQINAVQKEMKAAADPAVVEYWKSIIEVLEQYQTKLNDITDTEKQYKQDKETIKNQEKDLNKIYEEQTKKVQDLHRIKEAATEAEITGAKQQAAAEKEGDQAANDRIKRNQTIAVGISNIVSGISSLAMSLSSLSNIISQTINGEADFLSVTSSLAFTIPMLVTGVKSVVTAVQSLAVVSKGAAAAVGVLSGAFGALLATATVLKIIKNYQNKQIEKTIEDYKKQAEAAKKVIDAQQEEYEKVSQLIDAYKTLHQEYQNGSASIEQLRLQTYELLKSYGLVQEAIQALTASEPELNKLIGSYIVEKYKDEIKELEGSNGIEKLVLDYKKVIAEATRQKKYQDITLYYKAEEEDEEDQKKVISYYDVAKGTNEQTVSLVQELEKILGVQLIKSTNNKIGIKNEQDNDLTYANEQILDLSALTSEDVFQNIAKNKDEISAAFARVQGPKRGVDYNRLQELFYGDEGIFNTTDTYIEKKDLLQNIKISLATQNATNGWYGYKEEDIADYVEALKQEYEKTAGLTGSEVTNQIIQAFTEEGKFKDYQKYIVKQTEPYAKMLEQYGEDITDIQLDALYKMAANSNGQIDDKIIELYLKSQEQELNNNLQKVIANYLDKDKFVEEDVETLLQDDLFKEWLNNTTNTTIEQFQAKGKELQDSYISDYLAYLTNPENSNIIKTKQEEIKKLLAQVEEQLASRVDELAEDLTNKEMQKRKEEPGFNKIPTSDLLQIRKQIKEGFQEEVLNGDDFIVKTLLESQNSYDAIIKNLEHFKYSAEDAFKIDTSLFSRLTNNINKIQSAYDTLTDTVKTYNETGYITLDQVQSLVELDPALLNALFDENGQLNIQEDSMEKLLQVQIEQIRLNIVRQGEERAQLILQGNMNKSNLMLWESQEMVAGALEHTGESTLAASERIHAYTQQLIADNKDISDDIVKQLEENETYTKNQLKLYDNIDYKKILKGRNSAEEDNLETIEAELDIYHDINIELEKINKATERLKKTRDKLIGQDLLNSYADEITLLNTENNALERKLALQQKDAADKRTELGAHGVAFDANGQVANYNTILKRWADQVNAVTDKEQREVMEEQRQKLVETLKDYEDLWNNEIEEVKDKLTDNSAAIIQAQVDRMNIVVDTTIDLKDLKRKFNEFKRDYIDKLLPTEFAKAIDTINNNMSATYQAMGMSYDYVTKALAEVQKMQEGFESDLYGNNINLALEDLRSNSEKLQAAMQEVTEDLVAATEKYRESIDELSNAFDRQTEYLEKLAGAYDKQTKAYQLLYGENGAASVAAQNLETISDIYNKQADKYAQQASYWQSKISEWEATLNDPAITTELAQALTEQIKDAQDKMIDANEKAGEAYVNAVEKANEGFAQRIAAENNKLAEGILGQSLDKFKADWEATKELSDMYYDNVNRAYQTSLLMGKYQKSINENTGSAQQKLQNAYDKELATLKEKDKLTKYDLERAEKRYQLVLAQIALEEAQQNKNTLKLARDSQGNYTYQYVADSDAINEAQDKVNSLANDIYNLDKDNWRANTDAIIADLERLSQKAAEVFRIFGADSDEGNEVVAKYYEKLNELANQRITIAGNSEESMVSELKRIADSDDVAQLIGNKEYNLEKEKYTDLANANLLKMEEALVNALSNERNRLNQDTILQNAQLTDDVAQNLDKNFIKWSQTNENINQDTHELMVNINGELISLQDATDNVLTAIEERNLQVLGVIQDNSQLAVAAYDEMVKKIAEELIPAHEKYVDELQQEVEFTEHALDACDKLARKFDNLYSSSGKVIEQVTGIYDALKKFDELSDTITKTIITDYQVKGADKPGGLTAGIPEGTGKASTDGINNGDQFSITDFKYTLPNVHSQPTYNNFGSYEVKALANSPIKYELTAAPNNPYPIHISGGYGDKSGYIDADTFITMATMYGNVSRGTANIPIKYKDISGQPDNVVVTFLDGSQKTTTKLVGIDIVNSARKKQWSFDTGGYTGEWANGSNEGRMALLHQKEIVLNATDTANLLDMVKYQREMLMIERDAALNKVSAVNESLKSNGGIINPIYNITASFPNAVDHKEIELAILDLPNFAAQRANSNLM